MAGQPPVQEAGTPPTDQEGGGEDQGGGQQGAGGLGDLMMNVGKGMSIIIGELDKVPQVQPAQKQALAKCLTDYQTIVKSIINGESQPGGQQPAEMGNVPMEAGGSKTAQPLPAGA